MYSNIWASFHETVPSMHYNIGDLLAAELGKAVNCFWEVFTFLFRRQGHWVVANPQFPGHGGELRISRVRDSRESGMTGTLDKEELPSSGIPGSQELLVSRHRAKLPKPSLKALTLTVKRQKNLKNKLFHGNCKGYNF